jgi:hypothetical protein
VIEEKLGEGHEKIDQAASQTLPPPSPSLFLIGKAH